ncbi:MAG: LytTR family DNA-binding domain-containing protein [Bacteroidota bacterium]
MQKIESLKCLIVEDEPIAAEVLQDYINDVEYLDLKGICTDALSALDFLKKESVDVLFLDIHLPKLKGLTMLKTLSHPPQTILTTAYHQYTLEGFELGVVDYLMKPIGFPRFLKAIQKLRFPETPQTTEPTLIAQAGRPYHFFNVNKKMVRIYFDEVLYIESLKEYAKIFTKEGYYVTRGQIGQMEGLFQDYRFLRIHRSYLVALDHIKAYGASAVEIAGSSIPIGRSYRTKVEAILKNL